MRPHIIFRYTGIILLFNAGFLFVSSLISLVYSDSAIMPLLYSAITSTLFGIFPFIFVPPASEISNKEGFIIVVSSWLISCLIGVMPYMLWGGEFSLTNAWFESVSGFTTTGSTIITDVESLPHGLLFWRASTHWIGGIGIIIFVLSVIPSMGKSGMILYKAEMSALATENFHFRAKKALHILAIVYVGLTIGEIVCLLFCGMNLFDAVTHSFATIATGGFSTKNSSIAHYGSISIEIVVMVFMVLSGIHFGLLFSAIREKTFDILRSPVTKYYFSALIIGTIIIAIDIYYTRSMSIGLALRDSAFQVISLGTSTGFATADTSGWPSFSQIILIFFTLQCACAGSTSGGIKTDRMVIFWKGVQKRLSMIKHPHAVITPKLGGSPIDIETFESCFIYIVLYVVTVFVSSLILTAFGVDLLSAFSGSAAAMGNVGPGFGTVGSMGNFSLIPDPGKWVLSFTMLLGRLEIFALILFVTIKSWK